MNDIKISIVASSIRPQYWHSIYETLNANKLKWEAIMVGPNEGVIPPNFKYIKSNVKPAQCYEIGFRNASAELLMWTADDVTYSPNALDNAYNFWKDFNDRRIVVAFRAIEDGRDITEWHRLRGRDPDAPRMAPFGMMSTELFHELGGYDKRFICGQSENDVVMRVYEIGGDVKICNNAHAIASHERAHFNGTVFRQGYYFEDRKVLEKSWIKDGLIQLYRLDEVQRFDDENITTITQGQKGQW
jgi:hypothetical protein